MKNPANPKITEILSAIDDEATRLDQAAALALILAMDAQIEPAVSKALHGIHGLMVSAVGQLREIG